MLYFPNIRKNFSIGKIEFCSFCNINNYLYSKLHQTTLNSMPSKDKGKEKSKSKKGKEKGKEKEKSKSKKDKGSTANAVLERLDELFAVIKEKIVKEYHKEIRKDLKKELKSKGKKTKNPGTPVKLPKKLGKLLGKDKMTRSEVSHAVSEYAKNKKLKLNKTVNGKKKSFTKCNKKLAEALTSSKYKVKEGDKVPFEDFSKIYSAILPKVQKNASKEKAKEDDAGSESE